ncbi:MAG: transposase [Burkholderiales bacterium]|nr:transposase [Burkholderiales bacterium]
MARQHRLVIPGLAHLVSLPALAGLQPFPTPDDRTRFLAILRDAAAAQAMPVHAYALLPGELRTLVTPPTDAALSRWVQAIGRRYVSAYNRHHARSGTLWAGRFRSAPIEPGLWTLRALRFVDGAAERDVTSAAHRCGGRRDGTLVDPQEYWSLGNTPFERESAYASLLAEPLPDPQVARLRRCLTGGWVCGDEAFVRRLAAFDGPRIAPRPRGRPARRT